MSALSKSLLLFAMNWLDAQLTVIWVRANLATEGNGIMGWVLNLGNTPFILTKLTVGAFAAYVLYRCSYMPLARKGMTLVLGIYCALMLVHLATGISALELRAPETILAYVG